MKTKLDNANIISANISSSDICKQNLIMLISFLLIFHQIYVLHICITKLDNANIISANILSDIYAKILIEKSR